MEPEWTLVLWDIGEYLWCTLTLLRQTFLCHEIPLGPTPHVNHISVLVENVPIPKELWDTAGIVKLTDLLRDFFATSRQKQLHCIKFATNWPDYRSAYADLLGTLTQVGDMEALTYHWQGKADKNHNADHMLMRVCRNLNASTAALQSCQAICECKAAVGVCYSADCCACRVGVSNVGSHVLQAAQRFAHMMGRFTMKPEHLVVFITSDADFQNVIPDLKARNLKVEVVFHEPLTSQKPRSIKNTAHMAYPWKAFLEDHLDMSPLTVEAYPESMKQPGTGVIRYFPSSNKWLQPHGGAPAKPLAPLTSAYTGHQPKQAQSVAMHSCSVHSALVMLSGWPPVQARSVDEQCRLILQAYVSSQAAEAAHTYVANDSNSALLDFSSLTSSSQHAAISAALLLDGVPFRDFVVSAQLMSCSDSALTGKFKGLHCNGSTSADPCNKFAGAGSHPLDWPGSSKQHTGQGYNPQHQPKPRQLHDRPILDKQPEPSNVNRQPSKGPVRTIPAAPAQGIGMQATAPAPAHQAAGGASNRVSSSTPAGGNRVPATNSSQPYKADVGKSDHGATVNSGPAANQDDSTANSLSAHMDQCESDTSGDEFNDAFGLGALPAALQGQTQWGFQTVFDTDESFPADQCQLLQEQSHRLQCVDHVDQANSDLRYVPSLVYSCLGNVRLPVAFSTMHVYCNLASSTAILQQLK